MLVKRSAFRLFLFAPISMPAGGWTSSGHTHAELVNNLVRDRVIQDARVAAAMRAVDRGDYCPTRDMTAYQDTPLPIGYAQTISAPHMHAHALEVLKDQLTDGAQVLDVGVGTGYLAAAFAQMVGPRGVVYGIDNVPALVEMAQRNIGASAGDLLSGPSPRVRLSVGDGWVGMPGKQFAAIHVGAAAVTIPDALVAQLQPGGRMMVPVGGQSENQVLMAVDKLSDGSIKETALMGVRYVPLVR